MSSSTYSAEIRSTKCLRRVVLITASLMVLLGIGVIVLIPVAKTVAGVAGFAWICWSCAEVLTYWRIYRRWLGFRVAAGGETQVFGRGECCSAKVMPGSVILSEVAWVRLQAENGDVWGELVAGSHRESEEWRRFQVIFRHLNAA
jgi:hypothetical protein